MKFQDRSEYLVPTLCPTVPVPSGGPNASGLGSIYRFSFQFKLIDNRCENWAQRSQALSFDQLVRPQFGSDVSVGVRTDCSSSRSVECQEVVPTRPRWIYIPVQLPVQTYRQPGRKLGPTQTSFVVRPTSATTIRVGRISGGTYGLLIVAVCRLVSRYNRRRAMWLTMFWVVAALVVLVNDNVVRVDGAVSDGSSPRLCSYCG
jgi:hypothetical protein